MQSGTECHPVHYVVLPPPSLQSACRTKSSFLQEQSCAEHLWRERFAFQLELGEGHQVFVAAISTIAAYPRGPGGSRRLRSPGLVQHLQRPGRSSPADQVYLAAQTHTISSCITSLISCGMLDGIARLTSCSQSWVGLVNIPNSLGMSLIFSF